jgi:hypothetical protein
MGNVIKLGAVGALRNYSLKGQGGDSIAWSRGPANPFSAKVNTSGQYDEVDIWNEWVQENWQAGVGRVKPEDGGFLYGETDTRVPNQVILPQAIQIYTPHVRDNSVDYKSWSLAPRHVSAGQTRATYSLANNNYLAWQVDGDTTAGNNNISGVWVYGECADGTVLRADIYSEVASNPGIATGATGTLTVTNDFPGPQWHFIPCVFAGVPHTDAFWWVIRPTTGSFTPHGFSDLSPAMLVRSSTNGTVWSTVTTFQPFFVVQAVHATLARRIDDIGITTTSDEVIFWGLQGANDRPYGWARNTTSPYLVAAKIFAPQAAPPVRLSATVFDDNIVIGSGPLGVYVYRTSLALVGDTGDTGYETVLSHGGYLWGTNGTTDLIYRDSFSSSSTTVGQVCSGPWAIRSMAGLNGDVYLACDDGLYRNAPGNIIEGIAPWQPDEDNGRSMCSFDGALYVVVHGRVMRYGVDGSLQDVWVSRDDDLPSTRLGEVVSVTATDLWVVALVKSTTGRCSVWSYQDEGWHHVATLPTTTANVMKYIRIDGCLWISTSDGYAFGIYMPLNALNPYNDTASVYMPAGWIQQDKYYGGMYLLNKDFESVTTVGDNLSANVNVKYYFQDEGSTGWESLGTADTDGEELRWSTHSTRPQGKWVKLGALLTTNDADETPRVRAIITKCSPMVNDRFRDTITLTLKVNNQMPDGVPETTYTLAQQLAHIQSMISSVIPVIYQDPLGVQYEVRIVDHSMVPITFAYENSANAMKELQYTLVVEQVTNTTYSA